MQQALFETIIVRHDDPDSLELAFTQLLATFEETRPHAPVRLSVTMTSATEDLEALIDLLAEFHWDLAAVDQARLDRIDGGFEGSVVALDGFTMGQCGLASALRLPSNGGPMIYTPEGARGGWCGEPAIGVQDALVEALVVVHPDAQSLAQGFYQLATALDQIPQNAPDELVATVTVATLNLDDFIQFMEDGAWQIDAVDQSELARIGTDLEDALRDVDEYNGARCGLPMAFDTDDAFLAFLAACGLGIDRMEEVLTGEASDSTSAVQLGLSPADQVDLWREMTSTPELGIGDRLAPLVPFPDSHIVPASAIQSVFLWYVPRNSTTAIEVRVSYRSALNFDDTAALLAAAMSENGEIEVNDSTAGWMSISNTPRAFPTSTHRVALAEAGDETTVDITSTVETLSNELDTAMRQMVQSWHDDNWPDADMTELAVGKANYSWSSDLGLSVSTFSNHLLADDTSTDAVSSQFYDDLERFDTGWSPRNIGGATLFITPDDRSCAVLYKTVVSYSFLYDEDVPDATCQP